MLQTRKLTQDERQKISSLLAEMQSRNIVIPDEMKLDKSVTWPRDSDGYFVKVNGRRYTTSNQAAVDFVKSNARFVALISGRGGGKSASGSQKALEKIRQGQSGAVLNPDFENFKISTWPEFREWIPWDMVVPAHRYMRNSYWQPHQPFVLAFINGVRVYCKGLKDPDSARGPNINWLWYDEAGRDLTGEAWQVAVASVRVGKDPQAWITTTPRGRSHWIYSFFVKKDIPEDALELFEKEGMGRTLIDMFYTDIYANQQNLDPGFMASILAAYPAGWLRDQEVFGKFIDEGGNLADRTWFRDKILPAIPDGVTIRKRVLYFDLAATEKKLVAGKKRNDPDETVATLMSWDGTNFYIEKQSGGFFAWDELKEFVVNTVSKGSPSTEVWLEEEPGSGGKNQVAELHNTIRKELPGHPGAKGYRPEGDRVMLANVWFANAKEGNVYLIDGSWIPPFFDQLDEFPEGKHDDKITGISGARMKVAPIRRWKHIDFLHL